MSDLTFFTNEPHQTLLDRFRTMLKHVRYFDVLVGYFRTSGFHLLHESFEDIENIRILVGLNLDRQAFEMIEGASSQGRLDFVSHQQAQKRFGDELAQEMAASPDTYQTEIGVGKFVAFLQSGKLEIKAHPSQNLHAKVYISRFPDGHYDFGRVITGSSNFSKSGLVGNYEFNVELKNRSDVLYALDKFEGLWREAVDISEVYVDTIRRRTWLNEQIMPYELYLKFLYEYFKEDIHSDQEVDVYLPPGFLELSYQKQAMVSAKKILESYNGVFLADVVGLGKTFIAALLAQQLPGKKLVICPPVLQEYWEKTFFQFNVTAVVQSMGKLDQILAHNPERFDYVFVDEAHRFRNEETQSYEKLHRICWGKKVILVSATPLNNRIDDIYSQLKLFQPAKKSLIPGVANLEGFFKGCRRRIGQYEKGSAEYFEAVKAVSQEVRNKILSHVMVRRTRREIINFFSDDIEKQGLFFPELAEPQRIIYEFDAQLDGVFTQTMQLLRQFTYSRYAPLLYLKKPVSHFAAQSQHNIGGFMKSILVKRLESSFFAFKRTLQRFILSYQRFIEMYNQGTVYISQKVNVYELLDADDEAQLLALVEAGEVQGYEASAFKATFLAALTEDLERLLAVQAWWREVVQDPKLAQFVRELRQNPFLKQQKVIVFTESSETGAYLYESLERYFPKRVLFYSSAHRLYQGQQLSKSQAREMIAANYDPNDTGKQQNQLRILITTDVLAEGINLHRSNVVINYDLPWNPTRVLQRVGRVNRVGTSHSLVYIFNFFPTAQSDEELGLEDNIKSKIQAFHDMLGEDAKYLTDEEHISQFELFGDRLYRRLNSKQSFESQDETERSELEFLRLIQQVRDEDPTLFDKIKRLPKKARSSRLITGSRLAEGDYLLSFFRRGRLKKFFLGNQSEVLELTFLDAVELLECDVDSVRGSIPKAYYDLLRRNKEQFALALSPAAQEVEPNRGRSNEQFIIRLLKSKAIKHFKGFTDDDEDYLKAVLAAFQKGVIPRNTSKRLKKALEAQIKKKKGVTPLDWLPLFKKNLPDSILYQRDERYDHQKVAQQEVILSAYLVKS